MRVRPPNGKPRSVPWSACARVCKMAAGASMPWQEALQALTGETEMDASAILDYFAPLSTWLDTQTQGLTCGY